MKLKIVFFLLLAASTLKAQESYTDIEDYWEIELSPLNDLNSIVSYISRDPYNWLFIKNIPGSNPLEREISVNSFYGTRVHPVHGVFKFHRGIDLKGFLGENVIASGNGTITEVGFKADLGKFIRIQHKYGFESLYGHLSKISVKKGQKICKGERIGKVGATGKVTGPHLHYTLKKSNLYLDPFDFLYMDFKPLE